MKSNSIDAKAINDDFYKNFKEAEAKVNQEYEKSQTSFVETSELIRLKREQIKNKWQ